MTSRINLMAIESLPRSRGRRSRRENPESRRAARLHFERLEDRIILSTLDFLVNTALPISASPTATSGGIADAINAANSDTTDSAVSITFDPSVFSGISRTIQLASGLDLNPTNTNLSVTIDATSAGGVTLRGDYNTTSFSVLTLSAGTANLTDLTITNGFAADYGVDSGGGISNSATMNLVDCSVINNFAQGNGGASGGGGGGIFNDGTLTVTDSTVSGNTAFGSNFGAIGGGILNDGTLTLTNSTIANNASANSGGGIYSDTGSHATLLNDTIYGNSILSFGTAAGLENNSGNDINLTNTIVAKNTSGGADLATDGASTFSGSFDIIGDDSSLSNLTNSQNNQYPADLPLAPLNYYGGPTETIALLGTPFIGTSEGAPTTDQRGFSRGSSVDIGAYQAQTTATDFLVTTANDPGVPGLMSLRGAIDLANLQTSDVTITFAATYDIQITVPTTLDLDNSNAGETITIDATSAGGVTVEGGGPSSDFGVFEVGDGTVNMTDLTISQGNSTDEEVGGGIYNDSTLTVTNCTITDNAASYEGGGIYNEGIITIVGSTISDNAMSGAGYGAGFENDYQATVTDSTISDNTASVVGSYGGGIGNYGTISVTDCTIDGNTINGVGGGIYNGGGESTTVTGGTISNNTASSGGGIYNEGTLDITGDAIGGNIASGVGGGIFSDSALTLAGVTISGNSAGADGGGVEDDDTTAIYSNSTFSNNTAVGDGGGIDNGSGISTVDNSTFNGNSANNGGGIANVMSTLTVNNSTFSGNSAVANGGGADLDGGTLNDCTFGGNTAATGGGIDNTATPLLLMDTIVASSTGGDFGGSAVAAGSSNNLIDDPAASTGLTDGLNGNIINHPASLSALGSYGGPTQTFSFLPGSPALSAGTTAVLTTLGDDLDASSTEIPVSSPYNVGVGIYIRVDDEIMLVVDVPNGNSLDVLRGQLGTTAATHSAGANLDIATDQRGILRSETAPAIGAFEIIVPTISNAGPGEGPSAGGTTVTLVGTQFQDGATVTVGGVSATDVVFVNATTITFTTPAGVSGPADIVVTNADGGTATDPGGFTYENPAIVVGPGTVLVPTVGDAFSEQLTASGGSGSGYTFSATGLPAGLTLSSSGLLSGMPTTAAAYTLVVTVTDSVNATGSQPYAITVDPAITLSPTTLPVPTVGSGYSEQLTASGGSGSGYTFSATGLPAGLTLSSSGLLSGTPTDATGTPISVVVTIIDGDGGTGGASYVLLVEASSSGSTGTITSVSGTVYLDLNVNGVMDTGEPGLAGRVVFLDLNGDGTLDAGDPTATTDASGNFTLTSSVTGTFAVVEATDQDSNDRYVVDQTVTNADGSVSIGVVPISPVAPVPVVPNPFSTSPSTDANTAYVQSLYKAVLGRTGADSEVATWLVKLNDGMTRQEVAVGFINSPEHRQDQVNAYYEEFLHRAPDPGSATWVNDLLSGVSEEDVVEGILDSPEYQSAHQDSTQFVQDLYIDVLGRQGESSGVSGWLTALASGTSREAVVAAFVQSTEAIDQVVDSFYTAYLHRQPEPVTSDIWVTMLEQPDGSASDVATGILSSPEFEQDATIPMN
jgi:fibronectin-binding autotransporter adhesin